jgi:uncharacterized Zn finger protein (UPF0148 family)
MAKVPGIEYEITCYSCGLYLYDSDRDERNAVCGECQTKFNEAKRENALRRVEAQARIDEIWEERVEVPTRGYQGRRRR